MDDADKSEEKNEVMLNAQTEAIRQRVAFIPAGGAGECVECGDPMPRLVLGVCCRCRDRLKLP